MGKISHLQANGDVNEDPHGSILNERLARVFRTHSSRPCASNHLEERNLHGLMMTHGKHSFCSCTVLLLLLVNRAMPIPSL